MAILAIGDIRIRYEAWGEGPAVTLLHGFTSSLEQNWAERSWVELLTGAGFRVVGIDLRGHGASSKLYAAEDYETSLMAEDVVHVHDALGIVRSSVVGFSLGAGVALQLAMDSPERVDRLVVCGIGDAAIRGQHDQREINDIHDALATPDPDAVSSPLARRLRAAAERGGNDLVALAAMTARGGWPGDLVDPRTVDKPVLVGVAGGDEYMRGVDRLLELLTRARVVTVPDASHTTILGDGDFRQAVLGFLREQEPEPVRRVEP